MAESADTESNSKRIFIALDLAPETREVIQAWQAGQTAHERLRQVRPDALHMTLAFLGDRAPDQVAAAAEVVDSLRWDPMPGGVLLPDPVPAPRRKPRLLALEVDAPALKPLQEHLVGALSGRGLTMGERRAFWPHITVFRLRRGRPGERPPRLEPLPDGAEHAFGAVRVALYCSELRPEGSKYTLLAANQLPDGDDQMR